MTQLEKLIKLQRGQGIKSNEHNVDILHALTLQWFNEISQPNLLPSDVRAAILTPDGRKFALGAILGKSKHWVCDSEGNMDINYPRLLMTYTALSSFGKVLVDDEFKVIAALLRFAFAQDYGRYIESLKNDRNLVIRPDFIIDEGVLDGRLPVYDRYIMAYITQPEESGNSYIVSYTDCVFDSFWRDVYGLSPEKRDILLKKRADAMNAKNPALRIKPEQSVRLLSGVPLRYEYRLIQNVLRGDYSFCTKFTFSLIDKYKKGELLDFRKGLRGRKPKTNDIFAERMYPQLSNVLLQRIERVNAFEAANNYGIRIHYVSPYFFSVFVPRGNIVNTKELLQELHAFKLPILNKRSLMNGDLL